MEYITIDDFAKVELRAGKILSVEPIEESNKLLRLTVDFGEETPRQVLSGIAKFYEDPQVLVGVQCAFVTNLPPREMVGLESQAMIVGFNTGDTFSVAHIDTSIPVGTKAK